MNSRRGKVRFPRFGTYHSLMTSPANWNRTLGVITCKFIRGTPEFNRVIELLSQLSLRKMIQEEGWHLVFTGGTFASLPGPVLEYPEYKGRLHGLAKSAAGVIQIANLVVYEHIFGVAFFNHMEDTYADSPQNLCLRRICNACDTPLFEDATSIEYIFRLWEKTKHRPQKKDPKKFPRSAIEEYYGTGPYRDLVLSSADLPRTQRADLSRETLAIVAHDKMKTEMLHFCLEHMAKILSYRRVISTGTTGGLLKKHLKVALKAFDFDAATRDQWGWDADRDKEAKFLDRKIQPLALGPKGGDVQISAKILDGTCHRILFFQDPQSAHPHHEDIRLMEKAVQDPETAALFATSKRTARLIVGSEGETPAPAP